MKREPVLTVGGIGAAAAAVLALLVAFGVPLTDDQQTAILGVVAVIAPVVVAVIARRFVTPVSSPQSFNLNNIDPVESLRQARENRNH